MPSLCPPHSVDARRRFFLLESLVESLRSTLEVRWEPRSSAFTICGSGIPRYRDEAIHFLGAEDRRLVTRVVLPDHTTIIRAVVPVALLTRNEPQRIWSTWAIFPGDCKRPGMASNPREGVGQHRLPTTNRNITEGMDRPRTGLVRFPSRFTQEFDRRFRKRQSVNQQWSHLPKARGTHDVSIGELHPGVGAQTLA